jgi:hypothetical protein
VKLFEIGTKTVWATAAAGALLLSGAVNAATVEATFTGISPGGSVSGMVPNKTITRGTGGIFNFNRIGGDAPVLLPGSGSPDNYFIGICIEFNEAISAAPAVATQTWTLKTLDKAPVTANESLPDGMGAIKADHIRLLLGQVMPDFELAPTLDNKTALALQIAIWEIVHETSGVYDPRESQGATRGTAYFYSPSPAYAVSMAYEWLKNINDGTWAGAARAENIFALTLDGVQDYIVQIVPPQVVPLPAAAWLLGSGLLGLFAVARRKKNAG